MDCQNKNRQLALQCQLVQFFFNLPFIIKMFYSQKILKYKNMQLHVAVEILYNQITVLAKKWHLCAHCLLSLQVLLGRTAWTMDNIELSLVLFSDTICELNYRFTKREWWLMGGGGNWYWELMRTLITHCALLTHRAPN